MIGSLILCKDDKHINKISSKHNSMCVKRMFTFISLDKRIFWLQPVWKNYASSKMARKKQIGLLIFKYRLALKKMDSVAKCKLGLTSTKKGFHSRLIQTQICDQKLWEKLFRNGKCIWEVLTSIIRLEHGFFQRNLYCIDISNH